MLKRAMNTFVLAAAALAVSMTAGTANAQRRMEKLGRGVVAMNEGDGKVFVSWRLLGTEPTDTAFNVYRAIGNAAPVKLNAQPLTAATCYQDSGVDTTKETSYFVRPVNGGSEGEISKPFLSGIAAGAQPLPYFNVPLQLPEGGTTPDGRAFNYTAGDASVGDVDGDGEYEIFLKWEPSNARDNSQAGYTGDVLIDCYKLDGTRLWRIDLGKNIRAGAHYTQFQVFDYDGDGKAEMFVKTSDATVDGKGKIIGDAKADWRNPNGYVLTGPEFLTVFNGQTGAAMATTDYIPARTYNDPVHAKPQEINQIWGDAYGNRVDRFLAGTAYLDGSLPSVIMCRGYYTRTVLAAWDWRDGKLTSKWVFDSDKMGTPDRSNNLRGQGNHNLCTGDVDNDGKDEIIYGAMGVTHDGKSLYSTGYGHGDAQHLGDLDPTHPGLEHFDIQERFSDAGEHMDDVLTGKTLWKTASVQAATSGGDKGEGPARGAAFNIDPRYPGSECWALGAGMTGMWSAQGKRISETHPRSCNFAVYWDGDLLQELLDRNTISKWDWKAERDIPVLTAEGCMSCNGTKATPCLSADLFGDWREEVIWRTNDNKNLRIYSTTIPTTHRYYTLMHDAQYREAIAWQNTAYNQPPHTSFYIDDQAQPQPKPNIVVNQ